MVETSSGNSDERSVGWIWSPLSAGRPESTPSLCPSSFCCSIVSCTGRERLSGDWSIHEVESSTYLLLLKDDYTALRDDNGQVADQSIGIAGLQEVSDLNVVVLATNHGCQLGVRVRLLVVKGASSFEWLV